MVKAIEKNKKTAIILFNLGGPDSLSAVKPFLFNLFNDPAIITLPNPFRYILAKYISYKRTPIAKDIYRQIGGKSPILENTKLQADALEYAINQTADLTNGEVKCFISMRYWNQMSDEVVEQVADFEPDHILLLPLYPQFSTTTTGSSFDDWRRAIKDSKIKHIPTSYIDSYQTNMGFISAQIQLIREMYFDASYKTQPRILFSAHGLPEKIIESGDPYQTQIEESVAAITNILMLPDLDYRICYQSRVGKLKWLEPSTEQEIDAAAKDGVDLIIVPISFVSEHSETLVELDIEYREYAAEKGIKHYRRVPTVQTNPYFIQGLAEICLALGSENVGDVLLSEAA